MKLKFGATASSAPLEIDVTPITVFVGPNNSGKSLVINEINFFCRTGHSSGLKIISDMEFLAVDDPEAELEKLIMPGVVHDNEQDAIYIGDQNLSRHLSKSSWFQIVSDPGNKSWFCENYAGLMTFVLDGSGRINLVGDLPAGNLKATPSNFMMSLLMDPVKRRRVRKILYEAFQQYFVIDPTNLGQLSISMSNVEPVNDAEECGIDPNSVRFHSAATPIHRFSDGVKAFTGIISTIIAGDRRILLIDEPEAFLHPSLAANLGREIGVNVNIYKKNLFASTHSAHFLMGCIQSGAPINIIRLTYSNGQPTARTLSSSSVLNLFRHPLLRSTGVLNALFYDAVIVTEGDADRAFYQEVNERLLMFDPERGISNCLFLNAQNKQTIHEIVRPLREMGIPCAAIVDVDVIKEGGIVWTNLMNAARMPQFTIDGTTSRRKNIKDKFDEKKPLNFKTDGGVNILDPKEQIACNDLFDSLDEYGIFAVRGGELESWFKKLGATSSHSPDWLVEIFNKMGSNPLEGGYLKPEDDDVWAFLFKIKSWLTKVDRKGML